MRSVVAVLAALLTTGLLPGAPPAAAEPPECDYPSCTPGIRPNVVLGSYCDNTTYYAFGVTSWGRLVFCGSPEEIRTAVVPLARDAWNQERKRTLPRPGR